MRKNIVFIVLFIFQQTGLFAQFPKVAIPGSQVRKINSVIVNREYELHILLPGGYANSNKKYPVVYLMDSQWDFPLVKSISGQQYYDGFIPELIIVGVTWGGTRPNPDSLRARDYTPSKVTGMPQSGGADLFLSFMKKELFPFIESNYKADSNNRVLMGCSLGGLISLYALVSHTDMFNGYIAASPAIGWDREIIYSYEKDLYGKKLSRPVRLYMTVGDVEQSRYAFERFSTYLKNKNYASLNIGSRILENTGHSGTKSETYSRGLQYIFERPKIDLTEAELNKFIGNYRTSNEENIKIKYENRNLVLYFSNGNKYILFSSGENSFYSTAVFFNVNFKMTDGRVEGFQLERYGATEFMTKRSPRDN